MSAGPRLATARAVFISDSAPTPPWVTSLAMLAIDVVVLSAIYWLTIIGRCLLSPARDLTFYFELFPVVALFLVVFQLQGLYPGLLLHPAEEIRKVFYGVTSVALLLGAATFLSRNAEAFSRSVFLIIWAAGTPIVVIARMMSRKMLSRSSWWGVPAVVFGTGPASRRVAQALKNPASGVRVAGVLTDNNGLDWDLSVCPLLGHFAAASEIAALKIAHYAIIAMPEKSNAELHDIIQDYCRGFRHILLVPDMLGLCSLGISSREISGEVGFEVPQRLFHASAATAKWLLDVCICLAVLIPLLPVLTFIALAIKLTSRGPIFYGHPRFGRDGEVFKALKFRTMVQNGDVVLAEYLRTHPEALSEWNKDHKLKNDPRITKLGKWLRRYSLDELPQLLNVLARQMSLVGPRPIVTAEIAKYGRGYDLYKRVLPGVTGLWQVSGRNNTTYEKRVAYDEYYVRNWSIWLDAYILIRTAKVVLTAEGAY
jgi:Undecaprenyl-phosphate galactose phosphotransferase WbaP